MFGIQVLRAPVPGNGNIGIKRLNWGHQISKDGAIWEYKHAPLTYFESIKITETTNINNNANVIATDSSHE